SADVTPVGPWAGSYAAPNNNVANKTAASATPHPTIAAREARLPASPTSAKQARTTAAAPTASQTAAMDAIAAGAAHTTTPHQRRSPTPAVSHAQAATARKA